MIMIIYRDLFFNCTAVDSPVLQIFITLRLAIKSGCVRQKRTTLLIV